MSVPTAFLPARDANRVKSFVHRWYAAFDELPNGQPQLLREMLSASDLLIRFGPVELNSRDAFVDFYLQLSKGVAGCAHHVHGVHVARGAPSGQFAVGIEALFQKVTPAGCVSSLASVQMTIVEVAGQLQITRYLVALDP